MSATSHPDYDKLPRCIQSIISRKQYLWMGDKERARLVEDICYPESEE